MKQFKKLWSVVLAASLCAALAGCGQNNETYPTIGTKEEGAFDVLLKNNTGKDVTGLSVKMDTEENYPENVLAKDFVLKNEETAEWFYLPKETQETADSETGVIFNPLYQVQITLSDASVYEISSFGFEDIDKEATLCLEDDILFIEYTSKESGETVNTKEQERAAKEQKAEAEKLESEKAAAEKAEAEKAAAEKAEAQKAIAEKATAEKAKSEKAPVQQTTPVQPSASKQTPTEEIPVQSTEGCLTEGGGPVFNE